MNSSAEALYTPAGPQTHTDKSMTKPPVLLSLRSTGVADSCSVGFSGAANCVGRFWLRVQNLWRATPQELVGLPSPFPPPNPHNLSSSPSSPSKPPIQTPPIHHHRPLRPTSPLNTTRYIIPSINSFPLATPKPHYLPLCCLQFSSLSPYHNNQRRVVPPRAPKSTLKERP